MNETTSETSLGLKELRDSFDSVFAQPENSTTPDLRDFLKVCIKGGIFALKVEDLSGITKCPALLRVPSDSPALLGIAGIKGRLVPVYGFAEWLGLGASNSELGWLVLCDTHNPVAFAFDEFQGYHRVVKESVLATGASDRFGPHLEGSVPFHGVHAPIVNTKGLAASIKGAVRGTIITKES